MRLLLTGLFVLCCYFIHWLNGAGSADIQASGLAPNFSAEGALETEASLAEPGQQLLSSASSPETSLGASLAMSLCLGPAGAPLADALVLLDNRDGVRLEPQLRARASSHGLCSFDELQAGTYRYVVQQADLSREWVGQLEIPAGAAILKRVDLSELTQVSGGASADALPGAHRE